VHVQAVAQTVIVDVVADAADIDAYGVFPMVAG